MRAPGLRTGGWNPATRLVFSRRLGEDKVSDIVVDAWLYGELARYGGTEDKGSYANVQVRLPEGSTVQDLLSHLNMPTEVRESHSSMET